MGSLNKVLLIGRLGADPEIRYSQAGSAVANFRLATSEFFVNKDGRKEERTEWHRVVCFGKLAKICEDYLKKGRQAFIEGRLRTRQWESGGQKRFTTEIVVINLQMLDSKTSSAIDMHDAPYRKDGLGQKMGEFSDESFPASELPVDIDEPASSIDKGGSIEGQDDDDLPF